MAERAKAVQESFRGPADRYRGSAGRTDEGNRSERAAQEGAGPKGLRRADLLRVYSTLLDDGIPKPEAVSQKIADAFAEYPNWQRSEKELRELRKQVTFAILRAGRRPGQSHRDRRCTCSRCCIRKRNPVRGEGMWQTRKSSRPRAWNGPTKLDVKVQTISTCAR